MTDLTLVIGNMNCRAKLPGKGMALGVQKDIDRITTIWKDCREILVLMVICYLVNSLLLMLCLLQ